MKREDFEKLKEKEKAHLREIQKLKARLKEAERARRIGKAMSDLEASGSTEDFDEALARVQLEALEGEAKLDFVIDSRSGITESKPDLAESEEELSKARAEELVRHMKISMGLSDEDEGLEPKPKTKTVSGEREDGKKEETPSPPGKTIGRRQRNDE